MKSMKMKMRLRILNMKIRNFLVGIKQGRFAFTSEHQKSLFALFLKQFEGKNVIITIDEKTPKRTQSQHNYYWLYMEVIAQETGHRKEELHAYFKSKYLTQTFVEVFGKKVRITKSTTELNKHEFGEYIDSIFHETEIPLPDPALAGYISN